MVKRGHQTMGCIWWYRYGEFKHRPELHECDPQKVNFTKGDLQKVILQSVISKRVHLTKCDPPKNNLTSCDPPKVYLNKCDLLQCLLKW